MRKSYLPHALLVETSTGDPAGRGAVMDQTLRTVRPTETRYTKRTILETGALYRGLSTDFVVSADSPFLRPSLFTHTHGPRCRPLSLRGSSLDGAVVPCTEGSDDTSVQESFSAGTRVSGVRPSLSDRGVPRLSRTVDSRVTPETLTVPRATSDVRESRRLSSTIKCVPIQKYNLAKKSNLIK